jgi:DNA gyrase/topoisomerase IV subunit B
MTTLRKNDIKVMSDIEHVLKRTHIYCGSTKEENIDTHLYSDDGIVFKNIPIIPALNKIISEIIDNARDEAVRTKFKYATKIEVEYVNGIICIKDNGRGLPIEYVEDAKKWTPEIIFTQLRSGSNFEDDERETAGMNGVGSALTAILSRRFAIDTCNGVKRYQQTYEMSLARINKPRISDISQLHYTEVTFEPNYDFFNITDEAKALLPNIIRKMLIELSFCYPEITFYFNRKKITAKSLKQFLTQIHEVHEFSETDKCRVGVFFSDTEFSQISFVNGLNTVRGGTHIDYVTNVIVEYLREFIKKKHKLDVKPIDIKSKLFLFLSLRMVNAQFDGQTKERCTNTTAEVKDILNAVLDEKFLKSITKNEEIMFPIVEAYRLKQEAKENQEARKITGNKKITIEKYLPASVTKKYLVLTEGDGAMGLISSVLGRKEFSYFPLKGKPLNALEVTRTKIMENDELRNIIQILSLNLNKDDQSDLTYENVLICTDADADGDAIKSGLLCFFYRFAPSLIAQGRIMFLQTPLLIAKQRGKVKHTFTTFEEYNTFKAKTTEKYDYTYIKGLGSNKKDDLKDMISKAGLDKFLYSFEMDDTTGESILNWMGKKTSNKRKEFLRDREFDIAGT